MGGFDASWNRSHYGKMRGETDERQEPLLSDQFTS